MENHDSAHLLESCFLATVYDFQGGGFFMCIYAFVMRFATRSILKNGKAKAIRLSTLDAICKALECQPGDILEYKSDEDTQG